MKWPKWIKKKNDRESEETTDVNAIGDNDTRPELDNLKMRINIKRIKTKRSKIGVKKDKIGEGKEMANRDEDNRRGANRK